MMWLALLLLFTTAFAGPVERRQAESTASEAASGVETPSLDDSQEIITSLVTITQLPSETALTVSTEPSPTLTQGLAGDEATESSDADEVTAPSSSNQGPDTVVTITLTSTRLEGRTVTVTMSSTSISTDFVTSTNFITFTPTSDSYDTFTVTRYTTVTMYADRLDGPSPVVTVKLEPRQNGVGARQNVPPAAIARRSTIFTTTTEIGSQVSDTTTTVTNLAVQETQARTTVDVVTTFVIQDRPRRTVTVDLTLTVTMASASRPTLETPTIDTDTTLSVSATESTVTASNHPAGGGLSTRAKTGIGAGSAGFVVLVGIIGGVAILRRRRPKQRRVHLLVYEPASKGPSQQPKTGTMVTNKLEDHTTQEDPIELDARRPGFEILPPTERTVLAAEPAMVRKRNSLGRGRRPPPLGSVPENYAIDGRTELLVPANYITSNGFRGHLPANVKPFKGLKRSGALRRPSRTHRVSPQTSTADQAVRRMEVYASQRHTDPRPQGRAFPLITGRD